MVLDRADLHVGNGADSEEQGTWHILTFLVFCADRGLLADHDVKALKEKPLGYFMTRMAGKLWGTDFTEEGAAFAEASYKNYLTELADLCVTHDIEHTYKICLQPNAEEIRGWMFEWLHEELELFRE